MPVTKNNTLPIYFSVATDGMMPGVHNLLHVSAWYSDGVTWERNILPQNGRVRSGAGISEEVREKLAIGAVPVTQAMEELVSWLERFHGLRLPVISSVGYWHLAHHLYALTGGKGFPLLSSPLD